MKYLILTTSAVILTGGGFLAGRESAGITRANLERAGRHEASSQKERDEAAAEAARLATVAADDARAVIAVRNATHEMEEVKDASETKMRHLDENLAFEQRGRLRLNRALMAETDANAAYELADIEDRRVSGKITDIDAERESHAVRKAAGKTKHDAEQAELKKQADELTEKAAFMEAEIKLGAAANDSLKRFMKGLLYSEERKALAAATKAADARMRALGLNPSPLPPELAEAAPQEPPAEK